MQIEQIQAQCEAAQVRYAALRTTARAIMADAEARLIRSSIPLSRFRGKPPTEERTNSKSAP